MAASPFGRLLSAGRQPSWALLDQGIHAANSFAATIVVARVLGPDAFGAFALVLAVWVSIWVAGRAVFSEPFVVRVARLPDREWRPEASAAAGAILTLGIGVALVIAVCGWLVPTAASIRPTLLVLAPFVPLLLLQDFWRVAAFSQSNGRLAVLSDAAWAAVQFAGFAILWATGAFSPATALFAWGVGGLAGFVVGLAQFRLPMRINASALSWARKVVRLGGWFGAGRGVQVLGWQVALVVIAALSGLGALGGLRSVHALFGPLGVILRGSELSGLPAMARAEGLALRRLVRGYLALLVGLALVYTTPIWLGRTFILGGLFGHLYVQFAGIVLPLGMMSVLTACGVPGYVALRAGGFGRSLFVLDTAVASVRVALVALLGLCAGVEGAAWGLATGSALHALGTWWLFRRSASKHGQPARWSIPETLPD
jgi:O-antigen/teichoic acid export membrane protein